MRIEQSTVALTSQRQATSLYLTRGSLEAWVGNRTGPNSSIRTLDLRSIDASAGAAAIGQLSAQGVAAAREAERNAAQNAARQMAAQFAGPLDDLWSVARKASDQRAASLTGVSADANDPTVTDPNLAVLIQIIERLTGRKVHLLRSADLQGNADARAAAAGREAAAAAEAARSGSRGQAANQPAGWGVSVHVEQVHQETESTNYQATGTVQTQDGQTVAFDFQVAMSRSETQTATLDIQAGDAVRKVDPIALNLADGPVSLSETRTEFDLNADGAAERIALPASGTYFLALDRNGSGTIDTGAELFGPTTGDGFDELRTLDEDANGWIDENDAAFAKLRLWSGPDSPTTSLAQAGVGALYVGGNVATDFQLKSAAGESLGQVRTSSVYLAESGKPGALQQVDLTA